MYDYSTRFVGIDPRAEGMVLHGTVGDFNADGLINVMDYRLLIGRGGGVFPPGNHGPQTSLISVDEIPGIDARDEQNLDS